MMTDRNDCPATPSQSMETLMQEAMASITPPEGLHEQILAAVAKEKRRVRLCALYRRIGVVAAAVLILVPAVSLPIFWQNREKAVPDAPKSVDTASPAEGDGVTLQATASDLFSDAVGGADDTHAAEESSNTSAPADAAEDKNLLFSAEEKQPETLCPPPAYVARPTQSTMTTSSETTAVATMTAPETIATKTSHDTVAPAETVPETEPAYYAVLRELVGADSFALWLASYAGDPTTAEAEAAAYAYFGLDR